MEIVLKSAEAPAFSLWCIALGYWGLIEGLATFAEEGGLHGGGVLALDGKTRSSRSLKLIFCVFLFLAWCFIFSM